MARIGGELARSNARGVSSRRFGRPYPIPPVVDPSSRLTPSLCLLRFPQGAKRDVLVILLANALIIPVSKRVNLSPVLGFLAAGILLGPNCLSIVSDVKAIEVRWCSLPPPPGYVVAMRPTAESTQCGGLVMSWLGGSRIQSSAVETVGSAHGDGLQGRGDPYGRNNTCRCNLRKPTPSATALDGRMLQAARRDLALPASREVYCCRLLEAEVRPCGWSCTRDGHGRPDCLAPPGARGEGCLSDSPRDTLVSGQSAPVPERTSKVSLWLAETGRRKYSYQRVCLQLPGKRLAPWPCSVLQRCLPDRRRRCCGYRVLGSGFVVHALGLLALY